MITVTISRSQRRRSLATGKTLSRNAVPKLTLIRTPFHVEFTEELYALLGEPVPCFTCNGTGLLGLGTLHERTCHRCGGECTQRHAYLLRMVAAGIVRANVVADEESEGWCSHRAIRHCCIGNICCVTDRESGKALESLCALGLIEANASGSAYRMTEPFAGMVSAAQASGGAF